MRHETTRPHSPRQRALAAQAQCPQTGRSVPRGFCHGHQKLTLTLLPPLSCDSPICLSKVLPGAHHPAGGLLGLNWGLSTLQRSRLDRTLETEQVAHVPNNVFYLTPVMFTK